MEYLIKLRPIEPYFFGGERTFGFGAEKEKKQSYYIISENVPSQPTLFGTLRYIILAQNNALIGQSNSDKADTLVGKESFSFEKVLKKEEQKFGIIDGISPLFLIKDKVWYIKTPNDHKPNTDNHKPKTDADKTPSYSPFNMIESPVKFGSGFTKYPNDYKAKDGFGGGYVSLDGKLSIVSDDKIFDTCVRVGINSHRTDKNVDNEESFFKKEYKMLDKDFSFAFIAKTTEPLKCETTIVFMGQGKSAFECTISETEQNLESNIKNSFKGKHSTNVNYAVSDFMPVSKTFPNEEKFDYYIADTKIIRNLETNRKADTYFNRLKKSDKLYKIINAGAVFFCEQDFYTNSGLNTIGMNIFVKI